MVKTGMSSPLMSSLLLLEEQADRTELKYKGVRKRKWGKWVPEIRLPNSRERIWLGSYDSVEKAALAFDVALYCLHGPGAEFNFPDKLPNIVGGQSLSPQEIQEVATRFANEKPTTTSNSNTIDWSFLDQLDSNEVASDFGVCHRLDNTGTACYYYPSSPPAPPPPPPIWNDSDHSGDEGYSSQHSFLWNF